MGHTSSNAQLLSIPPYIAGAISSAGFNMLGDKMHRRSYFLLTPQILVIISYYIITPLLLVHVEVPGLIGYTPLFKSITAKKQAPM